MLSRFAADAVTCAASQTKLRRTPASVSSAIAKTAKRLRASSNDRTCSIRQAEQISSICQRAA